MIIRMTIITAVLFSLFLTAGCNSVDITEYKGDGKISPTGFNKVSRGYKILFETFSLDQPFSGQYRIKDLPDFDKTCWVGLEISSENFTVDKHMKGELSIGLADSDQNTIFKCVAPLSKWRCSQVKSEPDKVQNFIYYLDSANESSFQIEQLPLNDGTLSVTYIPGGDSENIKAKILLKSGGEK